MMHLMIDVVKMFLYWFAFGSDRLHDIIVFFSLILAVILLVMFVDDKIMII